MSARTIHDVLLRPVVSEKSVAEIERNNYTFAVRPDANKFLIKAAVEAEFKVTVLAVRVQTVHAKQKSRGRRTKGMTSAWRKAVVTLAAGDKIELFEAV
jgi:large subunit ribosomal protein L23